MQKITSTITEIRVYKVPLPSKTLYNMSSSAVLTPESTIVEIIDSDGMIGYGEACMATPQAQDASNESIRFSLSVLAPILIGLNPMELNLISRTMDNTSKGESEGKAAINIACWDLIGKKLNKSVAELLGGNLTNEVTTYHVIGITSPEDAAAEATKLQLEGIRRLQLKAGGRPVTDDIASIKSVEKVLQGETVLDVDTNRGWTENEAIEVSNACSKITMSMEQPCATEEELFRLKPQIFHPLIIDESAKDMATISKMVTSKIADGFGMKITRVGGLTAMRSIRDFCLKTRTPMSSDDAWGGDIIAAAGVAVGSTIPAHLNRGAWLAHPYHQVHYDPINGPRIENGTVKLPEGGPGLGLVIAEGFFGDPEQIYQKQ